MGKKAGNNLQGWQGKASYCSSYISMAKDEEELKHFIRLAEFIRAEVENEHQVSLFSPELAY